MIKGLVACGSGIATSTVAQQAVKKILADAGIEADISKGNITEIPVKQNTVDIIFTTSNYTQPTKVPVIKVFGLISGIGKDKIKDEIVAACPVHRPFSGAQPAVGSVCPSGFFRPPHLPASCPGAGGAGRVLAVRHSSR